MVLAHTEHGIYEGFFHEDGIVYTNVVEGWIG